MNDIELIRRETAHYFKLSIHDLTGRFQQRHISTPRMIAMYLCRTMTKTSYPVIGEFFGGRDHSTVIHAFQRIGRSIELNDRNICKEIEAIKKRIAEKEIVE